MQHGSIRLVVLTFAMVGLVAACNLSEPPKKRAPEATQGEPLTTEEAQKEAVGEPSSEPAAAEQPQKLDRKAAMQKRNLRLRPKLPAAKLRNQRINVGRKSGAPFVNAKRAQDRRPKGNGAPQDPAAGATPAAPAAPAAGEEPAVAPVPAAEPPAIAEPPAAAEPSKALEPSKGEPATP